MRRTVHRDDDDEDRVEGKERRVAVRAPEDLGGGQAAAHRIEDGGEMRRHGEGQNRGAQPLRDEEAGAHSCLPNARRTSARFKPAIE